MTPNNIVHMALLKGLDMIAVADHNTAGNLPAVKAVADECGLKLLPAMELTAREEVHLLAYFQSVGDALRFADEIYPHLPDIENVPSLFGAQLRLDREDLTVGGERKLLLSALSLTLAELAGLIFEAGGAAVPAHINRGDNGLLNVLGMLPVDMRFTAFEVARSLPCPVDLGGYVVLKSSDAHRLDAIFEAEDAYVTPAGSPEDFVKVLRAQKSL